MQRSEILNKANQIVNGEREQAYGSPEDNFSVIATMWGAYLETQVTSADVAVMMILLKAARIASGTGSEDNWIDIAGYAACGGEIQTRGQEPVEMRWNE